MSWKLIHEPKDGDLVVYVGCHAVDWRPEYGKPTVAFVEDEMRTWYPNERLRELEQENAALKTQPCNHPGCPTCAKAYILKLEQENATLKGELNKEILAHHALDAFNLQLNQENERLKARLEDCYRHPQNYIHEPICSKQFGPRSECSVCSRSPHFHDELAKQYKEREAKLERAEKSLEEVLDKHQYYEENSGEGSGSYVTGVTDGHRCAAKIARRYFEEEQA